MFSLKKLLSEKAERDKKKKRQKKRRAIENAKELALEVGEAYISINDVSTEIPPAVQDKAKKKSKDKKMGPSWRFYNTLTDNFTEINNEPSTLLETGNIYDKQQLTMKKGTVVLNKTLNTMSNRKSNSNKKLRRVKTAVKKVPGKVPQSLKHMAKKSKKSKNTPKRPKSPKSLQNTSLNKIQKDNETRPTELDAEMIEFYNALNEDNLLSEDEVIADNANEDNMNEENMNEDTFFNSHEDNFEESNLTKESTTAHLVSSDLNSEMDAVDSSFDTKDSKPYLCSKIVGEHLLVALFPDTQLYLKGFYKLKLVSGSVSVLGYQFQEGEERSVFSPETNSTFPIKVLSGVQVKRFDKEKTKGLGVPLRWIKDFNISKDQFVAIVKLSSYESNMTNLLAETKMIGKRKSSSFNMDLWKNAVGVELIEDTGNPHHNHNLFKENYDWYAYLGDLQPMINQKQNIRLVISGGKAVGKSTLLKFLINSLLSNPNVPEVFCLDLDPGQAEFSLPSCLTLLRVTGPLLGASCFQRDVKNFTYERRIFLGDVSVNTILFEYLDVVQTLMSSYTELKTSAPLIVNTMGYTANIGFDIIIDILKIVDPTHVITIEGTSYNTNFPETLDSYRVNRINKGITSFKKVRLDYDLIIFETVSNFFGSSGAKFNRNLNVACYFSNLWKENEPNLIGETCNPPIVIDWTTVAIHVQGAFVPQTHILQSINASLVALCKVNPEFLEEVGDNLPLTVQDLNYWSRFNECLGWGIVRGIDPLTNQIHILTPMDHRQVHEEVNVIAKSKVLLPEQIQRLFSPDNAPYLKIRVDDY